MYIYINRLLVIKHDISGGYDSYIYIYTYMNRLLVIKHDISCGYAIT